MTSAIFFLTTGRCGTQSLARHLKKFYADKARVEHEPLRASYRPKLYLRRGLGLDAISTNPKVAKHLKEIRTTLREQDYVEVGWPSFAWAPILARLFGNSVRFVHLVRNPVRFALSMTTHGFYQPDRRSDEYTRYGQLDPYVPGVRYRSYRSRWPRMTAYEKSLFQWLEVNTLALNLGGRLDDSRFLSIRFEDLVNPSAETLADLLRFLGLPNRSDFFETFYSRPVDRFHWKSNKIADWHLIFDHPAIVRLSKKFGYDLKNLRSRSLRRRYVESYTRRLAWRLLRTPRRTWRSILGRLV